jgi:glyoxylase-like metal-dependent hydrolase (beta-lactamase superfamily II)
MTVLPFSLGPFATNCYLVWQEGLPDALLIDCADDAGALLAETERRQLRLRLAVLTHGHIDHIDALAELVRRTAPQVAAHELEAPMLRDPSLSGAALFGFTQEEVAAGRLLQEGSVVSLETTDLSFTVLHTPGHTRGSICLLGGGALFSGDTLFAGSIGRLDLPGGDEQAMAGSLARLMELPGGTVVYPGHGPATTIEDERTSNPWLGRG